MELESVAYRVAEMIAVHREFDRVVRLADRTFHYFSRGPDGRLAIHLLPVQSHRVALGNVLVGRYVEQPDEVKVAVPLGY
jgi:hypothetical protein